MPPDAGARGDRRPRSRRASESVRGPRSSRDRNRPLDTRLPSPRARRRARGGREPPDAPVQSRARRRRLRDSDRRYDARGFRLPPAPAVARRIGERDRRSVSLRPRAHAVRPPPARRRHALAGLQQAGRAHDHARHPHRRALRGVGAERAPRQRGRRFQRVGRPRPSDARDHTGRLLGNLPARSRAGRSVQVRGHRRERHARC